MGTYREVEFREVEFKVRRYGEDAEWKHILLFSSKEFIVNARFPQAIRAHAARIVLSLDGDVDSIRWNFQGAIHGHIVSFQSFPAVPESCRQEI